MSTICSCSSGGSGEVTRWPAKDPSIPVIVEFDFSGVTASVSAPAFLVDAYSRFGAEDANPTAVLLGGDVQGAVVRKTVSGGVDLVDYYITCRVARADGTPDLLVGMLPVRAI